MKKTFLIMTVFFVLIFVSALLFGNNLKQPVPDKDAGKETEKVTEKPVYEESDRIPFKSWIEKPDKIIRLKPDVKVKTSVSTSGVALSGIDPKMLRKDNENWLVAVKDGNEDYVKVVYKRYSTEYPDVELMSENILHYKNIGFYQCKYKDKYGAIDNDGKIVIPFKFFYPVLFATDDLFYFVSKNAREFREQFDDILNSSQEKTLKFPAAPDHVLRNPLSLGAVGIVDRQGKVVISAKYKMLRIINDKYILCQRFDRKKPYNQKGIIDYNNNIVIPMEYESLSYINDNLIIANIIRYASDNTPEKGYIINIKNEVLKTFIHHISPVITEQRKVFSENLFYSTESRAFLDKEGNCVCDSVWPQWYRVYDAGIVCNNPNRTFVLNSKGKEVYSGVNEEITGHRNCLKVFSRDKKLYGLIDKNGKVILDTIYEKYLYPTKITDEDKLNMREYVHKYLVFVSKDRSVLVNLDTFEKKEYKKEIAMLDSGGNVYEKENIDDKSFRFRKIE